MKIIAFYLPQFYTFPENDAWWGKGFTEWSNTRKAKPLFKGHYQPHTPINEDYYDLLNPSTFKRQIKDAKKYGIYGFCFYHYWFQGGKKLLERPVENFLNDKSLDIHFCLSWANESWTRVWDGNEGSRQILMRQEYGDKEEWKKHFEYLLPFFKDSRYIYENDMPLLVFYRPEIVPCFKEMIKYWRELATEYGLKGIRILAQGRAFCTKSRWRIYEEVDGCIAYEPMFTYAALEKPSGVHLLSNLIQYPQFSLHYFHRKCISKLVRMLRIPHKYPIDVCDFSVLWNAILSHKLKGNYYPGAFANWDNSARQGENGRIVVNSTPELFEEYMEKQIKLARERYHKSIIFFTAWNEWGEGSHLEADEKYGYAYLDAVKTALINTKEWPYAAEEITESLSSL